MEFFYIGKNAIEHLGYTDSETCLTSRFSILSGEEFDRHYPKYEEHLTDCYIDQDAVIYDSNLESINRCNYETLSWNHRNMNHPVPVRTVSDIDQDAKLRLSLDCPVRELPDEDYFMLMRYHSIYPIGHFVDQLQKLQDIDTNKTLLLSQITGHFPEIRKHLEYMGFNNIQSIKKKEREILHVKRLHYKSPTCLTSHVTNVGREYIVSKYKHLYKNTGDVKLYLKRSHRRKVVNEDDALLKKLGFIIIDGTEGIDKMVDLFGRAKVIIGPHGGMFAHTIFCQNDPIIIEFMPKKRINECFRACSRTCGLNHKCIYYDSLDDMYNIHVNWSEVFELIK